jgi:uncharacterized protein
MTRTVVGKVTSLWRYPVKSMLGERVEAVDVISTGILGDRAYALWDRQTQRIASAKNPHKWAKLLEFQATLAASPHPQAAMPPVRFTLPDSNDATSNDSNIDRILSQLLGRDVELLTAVPDTPSLDQYWPDLEGATNRDTITQLFMPAGTFFDSCPIHAITTATLARLQQLYPEGQFEPARFRPNIPIEPTVADPSFVENDWVGSQMTIGDRVCLSIDTACPRCVVTTVAQPDLPTDLNILRTTARHNNSIAGIRASVVRSGIIRCGDPIWLEA